MPNCQLTSADSHLTLFTNASKVFVVSHCSAKRHKAERLELSSTTPSPSHLPFNTGNPQAAQKLIFDREYCSTCAHLMQNCLIVQNDVISTAERHTSGIIM